MCSIVFVKVGIKLIRWMCTCGDVMVDALHRDGGVGNGVSLKVTHKALYTTVDLKTHTHTDTLSY